MSGIQQHWIVCLKRPGQDGAATVEVRYASDMAPSVLELAATQEDALRFDTQAEADTCAQLYRDRGIATDVDVFEVAGTWRK
jgi:hypothetical protein